MKWPWSKSETKTAQSLIALSNLPVSTWGRVDPSALLRDGYTGNAVAYRCVRMIAEAAASISWQSDDERVADLLIDPSPEASGRALLERLYTDLQITGNAWLEAVTPIVETEVGATAILVDGRLESTWLNSAQWNVPLYWQIGANDPILFIHSVE